MGTPKCTEKDGEEKQRKNERDKKREQKKMKTGLQNTKKEKTRLGKKM